MSPDDSGIYAEVAEDSGREGLHSFTCLNLLTLKVKLSFAVLRNFQLFSAHLPPLASLVSSSYRKVGGVG